MVDLQPSFHSDLWPSSKQQRKLASPTADSSFKLLARPATKMVELRIHPQHKAGWHGITSRANYLDQGPDPGGICACDGVAHPIDPQRATLPEKSKPSSSSSRPTSDPSEASFPQFSRLPPELRCMIWREAVDPFMFVAQLNMHYHPSSGEEEDGQQDLGPRLELITFDCKCNHHPHYRHAIPVTLAVCRESLRNTRRAIPVTYGVCRESRATAKLHYGVLDPQNINMMDPFDPDRDSLLLLPGWRSDLDPALVERRVPRWKLFCIAHQIDCHPRMTGCALGVWFSRRDARLMAQPTYTCVTPRTLRSSVLRRARHVVVQLEFGRGTYDDTRPILPVKRPRVLPMHLWCYGTGMWDAMDLLHVHDQRDRDERNPLLLVVKSCADLERLRLELVYERETNIGNEPKTATLESIERLLHLFKHDRQPSGRVKLLEVARVTWDG